MKYSILVLLKRQFCRSNSCSHYKKIIADKYRGIKSYKNIIKEFKQENLQTTHQRILFMGLMFGISEKVLLYKIGKPKAVVNVPDCGFITIFCYSQKMNNLKVRSEYHFYKKELFLVTVEFYTKDEKKLDEVMEVLKNKYGEVSMSGKTIFKNNYNNAVSINRSIGLYLTYFSLNSNFYKTHKQQDVIKKHRIQKIKEKETYLLYKNL